MALVRDHTGLVTMEWRHVLVATWAVDPVLLWPFLPAHTSLDLWNGRALMSVAGLRVLNLQLAGVPLPFHRDLEQIDFRFYVRRQVAGVTRRGLAFIRQIVPSVSLVVAARWLFNEPSVAAATRHDVQPGEHGWTAYEWLVGNRWNRMSAVRGGTAVKPADGSLERLLMDRPWAYSRRTDGSVLEVRAEYPPWEAWPVDEFRFDCDVAALVGDDFAPALAADPVSTLVAVGSPVTLHAGRVIA